LVEVNRLKYCVTSKEIPISSKEFDVILTVHRR